MKTIDLVELEKDLAELAASREVYEFDDACVTLSYDPADLLSADELFKETPINGNTYTNIR